MELRLERWRDLMENNRLKVSRAKTEDLQTTGDTDQLGYDEEIWRQKFSTCQQSSHSNI